MPSYVGAGVKAESATNVANPSTLVPGLPTSTSGDWWFCHTSCTSTTATVATPAGWASVYNVLGTAGRLAGFVRETDGTETAPFIVWSGVTTGNSGTPSLARILNWGTGFIENAGSVVIDVQGTVSDQATSVSITAGGVGITTTAELAMVFAHGLKRDNGATAVAEVGTGLSWTTSTADNTLSGAGMLQLTAWGITDAPGVISDHTWTLTGGSSAISSGVMVAIEIFVPSEPGRLQYTKGIR